MTKYRVRFFDNEDADDVRSEYVDVRAGDLDELSDLIDEMWDQDDREIRFDGVEW